MAVHPTPEELESYLYGRIGPQRTDEVEEHLLICALCREECCHAEAERLAFRDAAAELERDAVLRPLRPVAGRRWLLWRVPVFAAAAVFGVVLTAITAMRHTPVGVSEVSLVAMRGIAETAVARRGTALRLHLDTTSLEPAERYRVELVDARGSALWSADMKPDAAGVAVSIDKAISAGRYWVRLNSTAGEPLREFQLDVR
jgi:hypothetical protein